MREICFRLKSSMADENSNDGNLYSQEYSHDNLITRNAKVINQTCFYGRAIGFQVRFKGPSLSDVIIFDDSGRKQVKEGGWVWKW